MSGFNRGDSGREVRLLFLKIHIQKKKKKHLRDDGGSEYREVV